MNTLCGLHRGRDVSFVTSSSFISGRWLPSVWGTHPSLLPPSLSLSRCFLPPLLISLPSSFLPSFHSTKTYWVPNEWTSLCPREQVPSLLGLRASRSHGGKTLQQKRSHSYRSARPELSANERGLRSCSARPSDWPWAKLGWTRSYLFPPL